ncbi:FAD:protein FMN transferase [Aeoliella sp. ICT_H6.2]|uniref:FAD:protein FMN transferase n=1 Tax=Aeoliella straminimaris TaxID=2954799 RepID=A0A9X2JGZ2_9BACT|nr:FAD:protein FMN transferase [Aeoliella straminimaris]MCO6044922.1 FAD:protein FMN transferase [Aeoliella straminimaris]
MSEKRSSHRRDFLTGRSAGQVAGDALLRVAGQVAEFADALVPAQLTTEASQAASYVVSLRRRAMACDFEVRLNADRARESTQSGSAMRALDLVDELETQMTVYRESSEVIDINYQAGSDWVEVEPRLFEVLVVADRLYHETQGAFDITGGPLSRAWGFDRRRGRLPSDEQIEAARKQVGWQHVKLDRQRGAIHFEKPEIEINLNSIGKGYALDRAAELMSDEGVENFSMHGGRSSLLARGHRTGERGWTVRLRHPLRPQQVVAEFVLVDQALSTSGSATQSFVLGGRRYGHLIDPRTGWPAEAMHSATVTAPTAALADALSTAFYVMGEEQVATYCAAHPEVQAVLVLPAERPGEVRLRTYNLGESSPAT